MRPLPGELHAQQLAADAAWLAQAREDGFKGEVYEAGADRLIAAAAAKVTAEILSGEMMKASAALGRPVSAEEAGLRQLRACPADVETLTWDVVERAWKRFLEKGLIGGQWTPERGATLAGYLRRACVQEFKNAYMRWLPKFLKSGHEDPTNPTTLSELLARDRSPTLATPSAPPGFVIDDAAQAVLERLPIPERQVALLLALGYQKNEAAAILRVNTSTITRRLKKAQERLLPHYPDRRKR